VRNLQRSLAGLAWISWATGACGACRLHQLAELPTRIVAHQILVPGEVNGQAVSVLIDTGAEHSFLWEGAARRLGLSLQGLGQVAEYGAGGAAAPFLTSVKEIRIGSFAGKNMPVAVIASKRGQDPNRPAFVLGEDFFSGFGATEFDLAHGAIRLLRPENCKPDQVAYWASAYSLAELHGQTLRTQVLLNGQRLDALLDSGAMTSIVTRNAAQRAGVTPWVEAPQPVAQHVGIGGKAFDVWEGIFDSFSIGDETVRKVPLRIADLFDADKAVATGSHLSLQPVDFPSMLIGCDFFLSHRLMVLSKEHTLVFTYSGGPVFATLRPPPAPAAGNPTDSGATR